MIQQCNNRCLVTARGGHRRGSGTGEEELVEESFEIHEKVAEVTGGVGSCDLPTCPRLAANWQLGAVIAPIRIHHGRYLKRRDGLLLVVSSGESATLGAAVEYTSLESDGMR